MITALIAVAASAVTAFATWRLCRAGQVLDAILLDVRTEPEPAEVEELARALHEDRERNDGEPGEWDRQSARAALLWMKQRGESLAMRRITVTASTMAQANPSPATLGGGYRYRGITGWNPAAGVHGEVTKPQPSACREVNEGRKAARYRRFCELREAGVAVLRAAEDPAVNIQPKTARSYEAERLAGIQQQRGERRDA